MNTTKGVAIGKKIDELTTLPTLAILPGTILYRHQDTGYQQGFHFNRPVDKTKMGRYDSIKMSVCYLADTPDIALAEAFLQDGQPTMIMVSDLALYDMAQVSVNTFRTLQMLDIRALLPLINHKLDELTGPDRSLTQAIVSYFADNPKHSIDGIAYIGRHLSNALCYAVFKPSEQGIYLRTESITRLDKFVCPTTGLWGEEILTNRLGIKVASFD